MRAPATESGTAGEHAPRVLPASLCWEAHPSPDEHGDHFRRFGFTYIRGAISPEDVAIASREIDHIAAEAHALPDVRIIGRRNPLLPSCDREDVAGEDRSARTIRKITGVRALSGELARILVEPPAVVEVLHQLLGARVELYRDALMFKRARIGSEKPWHQDAVYWPFRPMHLVSALIAIDLSRAGNGCLQVVPGTHTNVYRHHKWDGELQMDVRTPPKGALHVEMEPGDCLIFHSLLVHASGPNTSDQDRRVSICSYSPGGLECLDPDLDPPLPISERDI